MKFNEYFKDRLNEAKLRAPGPVDEAKQMIQLFKSPVGDQDLDTLLPIWTPFATATSKKYKLKFILDRNFSLRSKNFKKGWGGWLNWFIVNAKKLKITEDD